MSKFPLDLSKFKRVSSSPTETILQHDEGHKLVVNHGALDQKKLSALNGLALLTQEKKIPEKKFAEGGDTSPEVININPPVQSEAPEEVAPAETPVATPAEPAAASVPVEPKAPSPEQPPSSETPSAPVEAQAPAAAPVSAAAVSPEQESNQQAWSHDKGDNVNLVNQEIAATANDLNKGLITPKTYGDLLGKQDTIGKIGSIFGLLVSGMGAGINHTENPVIAMWNHEIANDLEAQKQNINNKQTLLNLNRQRFPDIESATNFTRIQQNLLYLHKLSDDVQKHPLGSVRRAQAEQALAAVGQFVDTQNYQLTDQIASKQAFIKAIQSQTGTDDEAAFQSTQNMLRRGSPDQARLADENEKHHVAGIPGQSSVALTAENRETLQSKALLDQKIDEFIKFSQQHGGSIDPRVIAIGKAKAAELNGLYRQATRGGVYKEGEAHFINQVIDSNPAKFFNEVRGVIPKAMELKNSNTESLNSYKKSLGFPVQKQSSSSGRSQSAPAPQGGAVMGKDGKMYVKSSDGKYMIPVQ